MTATGSSYGPWVCAVDLTPGAPVESAAAAQPDQRVARVLVRLHGEPLGYLTAPVADGSVDADAIRATARATFGHRVAAHEAAERTLGCPAAPVEDRSVTVIVCTRDRTALLATCLARLAALTYPRLDVLVIDNAPTDSSTRCLVEDLAARDGRFSYAVEPRPGLSAARNAGLATAGGDVLAYTDDDVWVDPLWVHGLVRGFGRRPDVACVTGLVSTASITSGAEAYFDARAASWSSRMAPDLFDLSPDQFQVRGPLYPYSAGIFGTGANLAFDRRRLQDLGGFDEALGAGTETNGGEDLDIFVRVLRAGWAIAYEPSALVWHHHRADDDALLRQMFGYGTGLAAFVTKCLLDPSTRPEVLRRVVHGMRRVGAVRRQTGDRLIEGVPRPPGAGSRELLGLLAGPVRYRRSVRRARRPAGLSA